MSSDLLSFSLSWTKIGKQRENIRRINAFCCAIVFVSKRTYWLICTAYNLTENQLSAGKHRSWQTSIKSALIMMSNTKAYRRLKALVLINREIS